MEVPRSGLIDDLTEFHSFQIIWFQPIADYVSFMEPCDLLTDISDNVRSISIGHAGSQGHLINRIVSELLELEKAVRRQGFWDRWWRELRECLAHLVGLIMRRICGEASGAFRLSFV